MSFSDALARNGGNAAAAVAAVFAEAGPGTAPPARAAPKDEYEEVTGQHETAGLPSMQTVLMRISENKAVPAAFSLMMLLTPAELPAMCAVDRFFQGVCNSDEFRKAYRKKWFITVRMKGDGTWDPQVDIQLRKDRTVGDAIRVFEARNGWAPGTKEVRVLSFPKEVWEMPHYVDTGSSLLGMLKSQTTQPPPGIDLVLEYTYLLRIKMPNVVRHYELMYSDDGTTVENFIG